MTDEQAAAVAQQLAQSRAAHLAYRQALREKAPTKARIQLQSASDLRTAAHSADPAHEAAAWEEELALKFEHDALVPFYAAQLARS